jgi:hypothetical protein
MGFVYTRSPIPITSSIKDTKQFANNCLITMCFNYSKDIDETPPPID